MGSDTRIAKVLGMIALKILYLGACGGISDYQTVWDIS